MSDRLFQSPRSSTLKGGPSVMPPCYTQVKSVGIAYIVCRMLNS